MSYLCSDDMTEDFIFWACIRSAYESVLARSDVDDWHFDHPGFDDDDTDCSKGKNG